MATAKEFKADLKRFDRKVEEALITIHREVTKDTRLRVAMRTPILTGRASASWNASVGAPNFIPKPEGYHNPGGASFDGSVSLGGLRVGGTTHVSNGVHYIGRLNAGSSRKAPAGFVEATVVEFSGAFPAIVKGVRSRVRV